MKGEKCGDNNMHWYDKGDTCVCGQIPRDIFFATPCSCGEYQKRQPMHHPECANVLWAMNRNRWIAEHQEIDPPLGASHPRVDRFPYKRHWAMK